MDSHSEEGYGFTLLKGKGFTRLIGLLSLQGNNLYGSLQEALKMLYLYNNSMVGRIPSKLSNCSNIEIILLFYNQFVGAIPTKLTFLSKLRGFFAHNNRLTGSIPPSLGSLSSLEELYVPLNNLGGSILSAQGQLINLTAIVLFENKFSEVNQLRGRLPFELGITTLPNLLDLSIAYSQFIGSIRPSISNASNLDVLQITANKFIGNVPSLEKLHRLKIFTTFRNNVGGSGEVDHALSFICSLTNATMLEGFVIQTNNFGCLTKMHCANKVTGMIPSGILNLVNLEVLKFEENLVLHRLKRLDLAQNNLSRNIPHSLGNLTLVLELVLGVNNLGGSVPSSLSNCKSLISLNLSHNDLNGSIPKLIFGSILPSFGSLRGLQTFYLFRNNLSGRILDFLVYMNSFLALVVENNQLCGGIPYMNLPKCNFKQSWNTKLTSTLKRETKVSISSSSGNFLLNISYQSLLKATDGFSSANLLGVGGFGSVYIGILDKSGTIIAVKVLNLLVDYHGNDFKVLVYEFMINISLEEWLHPAATEDEVHQNQRNLDMFQSNVLLDSEMLGQMGDFGIAIFSPGSNYNSSTTYSSTIGLRGTIGYAALEMFTGKRSTDEIFQGTLNLQFFVKTTLSQEIVEISDPSLFQERKDETTRNNGQNNCNITRRNKTQECLVLIFQIGVACSLEQLEKWMNVRDVVAELNLIRKMLTR
ncbi:hypothetical protein CIPAW_14G109300 [Carya illinoinensis]|uniref:Protein kinase domain-containing protein n=1 Tax=Carya illinoinensis TaxID=32201 RepID=A0A8T1NKU0_CARIL|nr:hypothetical protein CIPAW_14G109300 [Carya illinoinensis]